MVVCDTTYQDPMSGKHSLLGICTALSGREFPAVIPGLCVYLALTDGYGSTALKLALVPVSGGSPATKAEVELRFNDPRSVVEVVFRFERLSIPAPGEWVFQAEASDRIIAERRVLVTRRL